ncbi:MAG: preprotein translocase subunit YajC [Oscillospiraceae bacterium]|nr:preprotein translocase subunit YajC [Oscillospiraceae bacterium]
MNYYLLSNLFRAFTGGGSSSGGESTGRGSPVSMIVMMGAMFVLLYFVMIRPQKKKQKSEQEMRESIQIGDDITTIGGILGRVVTVKEDSLIVETGADRTKLKVARWAIQTNNTATERTEAEKQAAEAAKNADKEAQQQALTDGKKPRKVRRSKNDALDDGIKE